MSKWIKIAVNNCNIDVMTVCLSVCQGYNQMKSDTGVRGRHPDYTAVENTVSSYLQHQLVSHKQEL